MKEILLTQGKIALVDDHWFDELNKYKWQYSNGYAVRSVRTNGKKAKISMHRVVNNTPEGSETDHINHNRADNQESNLRDASKSQNMINREKTIKNKTSIYKGVSFNKDMDKWRAYITHNKKQIHLGYFNTPEQASIEYDVAAYVLFGEYISL